MVEKVERIALYLQNFYCILLYIIKLYSTITGYYIIDCRTALNLRLRLIPRLLQLSISMWKCIYVHMHVCICMYHRVCRGLKEKLNEQIVLPLCESPGQTLAIGHSSKHIYSLSHLVSPGWQFQFFLQIHFLSQVKWKGEEANARSII